MTGVTIAPAGIELRAAGDEEVLPSEALAFVALLHRELGPRRTELLARRHERTGTPDFLDETREIRSGDWRVSPPPADLPSSAR